MHGTPSAALLEFLTGPVGTGHVSVDLPTLVRECPSWRGIEIALPQRIPVHLYAACSGVDNQIIA